jgi:hypothetical protein
MKLVTIDREKIGLLVQLPTGSHVVDIVKSLGVFATHNPMSGAFVSSALKQRCAWVALVSGWSYLRQSFEFLARTALNNPDDPRVVIYPTACRQLIEHPPRGIVAIDITDAADLDLHDPFARLVMARRPSESVEGWVQQEPSLMGENVLAVDFSRRQLRTQDE